MNNFIGTLSKKWCGGKLGTGAEQLIDTFFSNFYWPIKKTRRKKLLRKSSDRMSTSRLNVHQHQPSHILPMFINIIVYYIIVKLCMCQPLLHHELNCSLIFRHNFHVYKIFIFSITGTAYFFIIINCS